MPTSEIERNKAISRRFSDAMNTNDPEIISSTIDELVDVDATIRTPLPLHVSGAQALKEVFLQVHGALSRPSRCNRRSDRGGGQGCQQEFGGWHAQGRAHGDRTNRQVRHV